MVELQTETEGTKVAVVELKVHENKIVLGDKEYFFPKAYKYEEWADANPEMLKGLTTDEFLIMMQLRTLEAEKEASETKTSPRYDSFVQELAKLFGEHFVLNLEEKTKKANIDWSEVRVS